MQSPMHWEVSTHTEFRSSVPAHRRTTNTIMDDIFRALADPGRRKLLDALFRTDGQTMTELNEHLAMSRFGVMKHLQILERAGLITSAKVGRERKHFLNPVPI